eukprot:746529-Hanusia_phi.AAC.1
MKSPRTRFPFPHTLPSPLLSSSLLFSPRSPSSPPRDLVVTVVHDEIIREERISKPFRRWEEEEEEEERKLQQTTTRISTHKEAEGSDVRRDGAEERKLHEVVDVNPSRVTNTFLFCLQLAHRSSFMPHPKHIFNLPRSQQEMRRDLERKRGESKGDEGEKRPEKE